MYGSLDIAVSGMIAQRTRMDVITANVVNKDAILDSKNEVNPYRRRITMFAPGDPTAKTPEGRRLGVHVADIALDPTPFQPSTYDPTSSYAYKDGPNKGYVAGTNIDPVTEQADSLEAGRAYEACAMAAETAKSMMAQGLRLLA
jgi:flagellar basal-body rod protein FlgC